MKQSQIAIIIGAVIILIGGYILIKTSNNPQTQVPQVETTTQKTTVTPDEGNTPQIQKDGQEKKANEEKKGTGASESAPLTTADNKQLDTTALASSPSVTYTESGYSPSMLHIKKGTAVTFKNESSTSMWTASAIHPTHTVYPSSDIRKCGTSDAPTIFDMCKGYTKGEQWSFTFGEIGTWKYHNHLRPADTGTIVVE